MSGRDLTAREFDEYTSNRYAVEGTARARVRRAARLSPMPTTHFRRPRWRDDVEAATARLGREAASAARTMKRVLMVAYHFPAARGQQRHPAHAALRPAPACVRLGAARPDGRPAGLRAHERRSCRRRSARRAGRARVCARYGASTLDRGALSGVPRAPRSLDDVAVRRRTRGPAPDPRPGAPTSSGRPIRSRRRTRSAMRSIGAPELAVDRRFPRSDGAGGISGGSAESGRASSASNRWRSAPPHDRSSPHPAPCGSTRRAIPSPASAWSLIENGYDDDSFAGIDAGAGVVAPRAGDWGRRAAPQRHRLPVRARPDAALRGAGAVAEIRRAAGGVGRITIQGERQRRAAARPRRGARGSPTSSARSRRLPTAVPSRR